MMFNRRELMSGVAAFGAALTLGPDAAWRRAHAQSPAVIKYGVYPDVSPFVWTSRDWTGRYGIKTEFSWYAGGGDVDNAMVAGQIDADGPGIGRIVSLAAAKPGEISQLMVWCYGDYAAALVAPGSPHKSMADLKGKKIGTAVGSGAYMAWLVYLEANGFKLEDFQVVNMAGGSIPAALASGGIDGAVIWEPFPALMENQKSGRIIQQFARWVSDLAILQTLSSTVEKQRDNVVKLIAGALDCQEFIRNNPKEAATIISEGMAARGLAVPPAAFEVVIKERLKWEPDFKNVEDSLVKVGQVALKLGRIPQAPKFNLRQDLLDAAKALRKA
jgi:ABC-type nitrate/sulfonate/bicarbonate transport system substrate-binding protein